MTTRDETSRFLFPALLMGALSWSACAETEPMSPASDASAGGSVDAVAARDTLPSAPSDGAVVVRSDVATAPPRDALQGDSAGPVDPPVGPREFVYSTTCSLPEEPPANTEVNLVEAFPLMARTVVLFWILSG